MAKTVEELQSGSDDLVQRREKLLLEIDLVSKDLAKAQAVVLSEVNAFTRTRVLSVRLSELGKERDALALQIEQAKVQPQHAQA